MTFSASRAHSALAAFRRAAAPTAPFGSFDAAAEAPCASLSLAFLAARIASASSTSAAAEHWRHLREESGFRAWVLVKSSGGRFCLQILQDNGSLLAVPSLLRASCALA